MNSLYQLTEAMDRKNKQILNEDPYGSKKELDAHLKHKNENPAYKNMSRKTYNKLGEYLYSELVDNKNIFGYVTSRNGKVRYCKWDKRSRIFICYEYRNGKPVTISSYMKSRKTYETQAAKQKEGEIPEGK